MSRLANREIGQFLWSLTPPRPQNSDLGDAETAAAQGIGNPDKDFLEAQDEYEEASAE
jgi:hypothetical protein